jgi:hypothetical protein
MSSCIGEQLEKVPGLQGKAKFAITTAAVDVPLVDPGTALEAQVQTVAESVMGMVRSNLERNMSSGGKKAMAAGSGKKHSN